jgi:hypothetical protein
MKEQINYSDVIEDVLAPASQIDHLISGGELASLSAVLVNLVRL